MNEEFINKDAVIGGCSRLPITIDAARLQREVRGMNPRHWGTTGARVGVHTQVEAVFFRGFAPAEGEDKPIIDREALDEVPYVREIIYDLIPAPVQRCVIASLKPDGHVRLHADEGDYFFKHVRLHFPVFTNNKVVMFVDGRSYRMRAGEAWALNNNAEHGVMNRHPTEARTHIIADFVPTEALLALLAQADKGLGVQDDRTLATLRGIRQQHQAAQPAT